MVLALANRAKASKAETLNDHPSFGDVDPLSVVPEFPGSFPAELNASPAWIALFTSCGVNEKLEAGVRRLNLNEKVGQLSGFEVERDNSGGLIYSLIRMLLEHLYGRPMHNSGGQRLVHYWNPSKEAYL